MGISQTPGAKRLEVRRIAANTPAFYSDLRVGDCIVSVNGVQSDNWTIGAAEQYFSSIYNADIAYIRKTEVIDLVNSDDSDDEDDDEFGDEFDDAGKIRLHNLVHWHVHFTSIIF